MRGEEAKAMLVLQRAGLNHLGLLGSGVEGTVADLGDGTVAKVWSGRGLSDLELLRACGDQAPQTLNAWSRPSYRPSNTTAIGTPSTAPRTL